MAITSTELIKEFKFEPYESFGHSKLRLKVGTEYVHTSGKKLLYNGELMLDLDLVTVNEFREILRRMKEAIRKVQKDDAAG